MIQQKTSCRNKNIAKRAKKCAESYFGKKISTDKPWIKAVLFIFRSLCGRLFCFALSSFLFRFIAKQLIKMLLRS